MSGDRMDVDEKEHISHSTSEKLEATLSVGIEIPQFCSFCSFFFLLKD